MKPDMGDKPVNFVSWFDAARFANWMHNGQPTGQQVAATTEDGAYTLAGATSGHASARNGGAEFFLPTENEWYKAAYYSPTLNSAAGGYSVYATQSDTAPGNTIGDGANQANYRSNVSGTAVYAVTQSGSFQSNQNYLTNVGAFTNSASYYGTFDQSGNVWEWTEVVVSGTFRGLRGGSWNNFASNVSSSGRGPTFPSNENDLFGFRLASPLDPDNQAPTDIALSATSIPENAGPNVLVGILSTTDPRWRRVV